MSEELSTAETEATQQQMRLVPSPQVLVSSLRQLRNAPDPYGGLSEVTKTFAEVTRLHNEVQKAIAEADFMAIRVNLAAMIFEAVGTTVAMGCNFDSEMQAMAHIHETIFDLTEEQVNATADAYRQHGIECRIDEVRLDAAAKPSFYRCFAVLPEGVASVEINDGPFAGTTVVDGQFLSSLRSTVAVSPFLRPRELFLRQMGYRHDEEQAQKELQELSAAVISAAEEKTEASEEASN